MSIEAMKQAVENMEWSTPQGREAYWALVKAISEAEKQEPVVFEKWHETNFVQSLEKYGDTYKNSHVRCRHQGWLGAKSNPQQRTWVDLTDDEMLMIYGQKHEGKKYSLGRMVQQALKEKNT